MAMSDLWRFDKLYGTRIVRVLYVIGVVIGIIAGLLAALGGILGMGQSLLGGLFNVIGAIIGTILGLVIWRVVCELWLVTFGIYDRLGDIKANTAGASKSG
jgi:uncharacterized membrane protein YdjX (TVP38/TMEM64 family)